MPSNQTPNYRLSQWERTDKVLMEDFNTDNAKIDAALKEHSAQIALKGCCEFIFYYRTGTGSYGESEPCELRVAKQPQFVIILDSKTGQFMMHAYYSEIGLSPWFPNSPITMKETSNREPDGTRNFILRWHSDTPEHQFNISYRGYCIIILCRA